MKANGAKSGEKLSRRYLCYAREHPIFWTAPTHILYGENDDLTSFETIYEFANEAGERITVMKIGEHRFSAAEQMRFLGERIQRYSRWRCPAGTKGTFYPSLYGQI